MKTLRWWAMAWALGMGWMGTGTAQPFSLQRHIPVSDQQGQPIPNPWSGGNNNVQYSSLDLNGDGKQDLVAFQRDGARFVPYISEGQPGEIKFRYAPEYWHNFDSCACVQWALLVDYTCDGRPDLFCGAGSGQNFKVYEQVLYPGDSVGFVLRHNPLLTQSNTLLNLYQTRTDIPAIVDVDYDGDIDIIATQAGFNTFALHRNRAVELFGRCDTLVFFRETSCWGHFYESSTTNDLFVADTVFCPRSTGDELPLDPGGSARHEGGALLVLDLNADSLMDVLVSDVSYPSVTAAFNGGTVAQAFMDSTEIFYPAGDVPIDVEIFPAMFHLDVNNDGIRDLLAAPNLKPGAENVNQVVVYINEGTDTYPDFRFRGRTFLPAGQLDAGDNAVPAFFQYDADGLPDLMIGGSYSNYKASPGLQATTELLLLRNTGTAAAPAYRVVTRNFLDVGELSPPASDLAPAAADLDGDGDQDIFLGCARGTIYHYRNLAPPGQPGMYLPVSGTWLRTSNGDSIDIGNASAPEFYDFDGDGDLDLFVGSQRGRIAYYRNEGTPQQHAFVLVTAQFGQIQLSNDFNSPFSGYARPRIADYDGDGQPELLAGEETGLTEIYDSFSSGLSAALVKSGDLFGFDAGAYAAPAAAVIDTSGQLTYVIGNANGGVYLWARSSGQQTTSSGRPLPETGIQLWPNPAGPEALLRLDAQIALPATLRLLSLQGQILMERTLYAPETRLDLGTLPGGLYLLEVQAGGQRRTARLLKR
ncbi:MAG: FG-GAP-like repeat-containing protein [Bacteroidia bacterium]|nr:FG-GAP-like repeat-containing protein [Bacteroidia bacterium]